MTAIVTPMPTNSLSNKGSIGLSINAKIIKVETLKATNIIEASMIGLDETGRITLATWAGLMAIVSNGGPGGDVGGPISVIKAGAQMAEVNPTALIGFIAALSINLGVLNALPLPALDGGQLLFVIVEGITKKKLKREIQEGITAWAFGLLLIFSLSTTVSDIMKINDPIVGFTGINREVSSNGK